VEKALCVQGRRRDDLVLAADTAVIVDGRILGKPLDAADAEAMLHTLQGRDHLVLTGVAVAGPDGCRSAVEETRVWISALSADEIRRYVGTGEPMDKAGAYAIQGLGSRFVYRIDGSYTNVVGLPIPTVVRLLEAPLPDFRR